MNDQVGFPEPEICNPTYDEFCSYFNVTPSPNWKIGKSFTHYYHRIDLPSHLGVFVPWDEYHKVMSFPLP